MGISKMEVARYYERVGELMMPYVANRPLAILRAPEGVGGDLFFQKNFPNHLPKNVEQQQIPDGATVFSVSNAEGLVSASWLEPSKRRSILGQHSGQTRHRGIPDMGSRSGFRGDLNKPWEPLFSYVTICASLASIPW